MFFRSCAKKYKLSTHVQQGNNLGERMANAAYEALAESGRVILMGTDCPGYTIEYINGAIEQLQKNRDVVVGPAFDGGYVLLGLSKFFNIG